MKNISQNGSLCNNLLFVSIRKNSFYLGVTKLLSYFSLALFGIIDLILYTTYILILNVINCRLKIKKCS